MRYYFLVMIACCGVLSVAADEPNKIELLVSSGEASFRGIAVVDSNTIVVGGSKGTVMRSTDAGASWNQLTIADDAGELDFRDVEVTGDGGLILMSAGPGEKSRIFRSADHGQSWQQVHINQFKKGFFNGVAFWDNGTGLVIGDPIDGRLFLLKSTDFGKTWNRIQGPKLKEGEYGFAASGTGIVTATDKQAWVVTGAAASRIINTSDYGESWSASESGIRNGEQGSGVFSIAVSDRYAVVVGGDYEKPELADRNCAWKSLQKTDDSWTLFNDQMPHKACVRFLDSSTAMAVGRTGIMIGTLADSKWKSVSTESFYTFDYDVKTGIAFLAGADGRIGKLAIRGVAETK